MIVTEAIEIGGKKYFTPEQWQLITQYKSLKSVYNWMKNNPNKVETVLGRKMIKAD